jgi:two-component system OmpR family response regulator
VTGPVLESTILIVEDDPDTAELLVLQLKGEGRQFDVARNGQEAILKTGGTPPDLVIMDLMMPRLDGFETMRFLKAKFQSGCLPILVLTARDDAQSQARGVRFGCDDYLTKPYDRGDLRASVALLIAVGSAENAAMVAALRVAAAEGGEGAAERAEAARTHSARADQAVVAVRMAMARLLSEGGRSGHMLGHLRRVLELDSDHAEAVALLAVAGGG